MIIAILNQHDNAGHGTIARSMAVLRARSGRKVCLVAADHANGAAPWCVARNSAGVLPTVAVRSIGCQVDKVERLSRQFDDLVVDIGGRHTDDCYDVLVMAKLAVLPVRANQMDLGRQHVLVERIKAARLLNHGLRTLFVCVGTQAEPIASELAAMRDHAARLGGATLAATRLCDLEHVDCGPGRCVGDVPFGDASGAQQMVGLYHDVYGTNPPMPVHLDLCVALPMLPGRAFAAL